MQIKSSKLTSTDKNFCDIAKFGQINLSDFKYETKQS